MTRGRAALGLALAIAALSGCGADSASDVSTVARAVDPPPIADTTSDTTQHTVPAANAVEPPAGGGEQAIDPGTSVDEPAAEAASTTAAPRRILSVADRASFARLASSLGGVEGLAVSGVGRGQAVERVGSLRSAIAWSTSKVPVAMAVLAAGQGAAHRSDLTQAITASDNAAALRLWSALGGGDAAAQAADAQLRAAGDTATQVESQALRGSAYTSFGQTVWSLADQTRFTAGMACSDAGAAVLGLMGDTVAGQRWGLGSAGVPAQLKGGWGPGSQPGVSGGYLDRQMGVVTVGGRRLAVAIATAPSDGSHATGTGNLTAIARWLVAHADAKAVPRSAACG
jgi:hypothetical protein